RHLQLEPNGNRGQRVLYVVHTRQVQRNVNRLAGRTVGLDLRFEVHAPSLMPNVDATDLSLLRQSVGGDRFRDERHNRSNICLVYATYGHAVERQTLDEVEESLTQPAEVVTVGLHMIGVDVGHYCEYWLQMKERRVRLVCLDYDEFAFAELGVRASCLQSAA